MNSLSKDTLNTDCDLLKISLRNLESLTLDFNFESLIRIFYSSSILVHIFGTNSCYGIIMVVWKILV